MTIDQFLEGKKVQLTDLFGAWKQKGFDSSSEDAETKITKKLSFMRCHFAKFLKKNPMPAAANCKFKREDVNGKGDGEWMLVLDCNGQPLAMFSASVEGFVQRYGEQGATPLQQEAKSAKEVQDSIPRELRKTWVNYALLDKINAECYAESCKKLFGIDVAAETAA